MSKAFVLKWFGIILGTLITVDLWYGAFIASLFIPDHAPSDGLILMVYPIIVCPLASLAGLLQTWIIHALKMPNKLLRHGLIISLGPWVGTLLMPINAVAVMIIILLIYAALSMLSIYLVCRLAVTVKN